MQLKQTRTEINNDNTKILHKAQLHRSFSKLIKARQFCKQTFIQFN